MVYQRPAPPKHDPRQQELIAKSRHGRPPKFLDGPMSPAEQKRRKRAEQRATQEVRDHRDLMAKLLKMYRPMQGTVVFDPDYPDAALAVQAQMHRQQREFFQAIDKEPNYQLQRLLETWKTLPDAHGRLHNERSGEADRVNGQSEIEMLADAQQLEDESGRRIVPAGCDPIQYMNVKGYRRVAPDNDAVQRKQRLFEHKMQLVSDRLMQTGACSICGSTDEDHIWKKWYESSAAEEKFLTLHSMGAPSVVRIMLHERVDYAHLNKIDEMLKEHWVVRTAKAAMSDPHGDPTTLWSDKWLADGWRGCFFSLIDGRTEVVVPSPGVARAFFGQSDFARKP